MIHPHRRDRRLIYAPALSRRSTESFPPISYFNSFPQVMAARMGANYLKCLPALRQPLRLDSGSASCRPPPWNRCSADGRPDVSARFGFFLLLWNPR